MVGRPVEYTDRVVREVRVERALWDELRSYAGAQGLSVTRVVHLALTEFLARRRGSTTHAPWNWQGDQ